ncbi:endonuclease [Arenimonas metalli]|uniref:endonuclease n=1 Tax=Arenimonas metalli TaxID=948077 RepID=UPI000558E832|nr:endonuclease [Arenimonas metalli]
MIIRTLRLLPLLLLCPSLAQAGAWINEIHYDNAGTDTGERIEVAGDAGTSLAGWTLHFYNGADRKVYATRSLSGTLGATCGAFGFASVDAAGLQNGAPDGVALTNASGTLVQFLSYEGSFKGADGPARNITSSNIGVSETEATPVGHSLQLGGSGTQYSNFTWRAAAASSFGTCNVAQTFPVPDLAPTITATSPADGSGSVALDANLSITFSEPVTLASGAVLLACDSGGSVAVATSGGPSQFTVDPQTSLPGLSDCIVDVVASRVTDRDGTPTPMAANYSFVFTTAAVPGLDYYSGVSTSSASAMRSSLHALIDDHQRFPYTSTATDTWDILEYADEDPTNPGRILDVYRNASYQKYGAGNTEYNREHTWPKSYGFTNDGSGNYPYTDTHMLFLSDAGYNSSRNNKPYADCLSNCVEKVTVANAGAGGGSGVFPGNSNWYDTTYWQTWGDRKGDVARALLYMDVRYEGGTHGVTGVAEPNLILTDDPGLIQASSSNLSVAYMGRLADLLRWHAEDPVDEKEILRNEAVYTYQGNRNPFIDHPEWVACVFQGVCP